MCPKLSLKYSLKKYMLGAMHSLFMHNLLHSLFYDFRLAKLEAKYVTSASVLMKFFQKVVLGWSLKILLLFSPQNDLCLAWWLFYLIALSQFGESKKRLVMMTPKVIRIKNLWGKTVPFQFLCFSFTFQHSVDRDLSVKETELRLHEIV